MKRLTLVLKLLLLALPMLASDCGPGLSYQYDLERAERQFAPQWSPDGALLVWGAGENILSVKADGTDMRVLSESRDLYDADVSPSVSPDGSHIVYATFKHATSFVGDLRDWEIESSRIDGSERRRLTKNSVADVNPEWSPDGNRIAWVSGGSIRVMQSDGTDAREIAPSITAMALPPQWSPDGRKIAFIAREERDPAEVKGINTEYEYMLYVAAEDGSGLSRMSESWVVSPTWSPDGLHLAFVKPAGRARSSTYIAKADGSESRELISFTPGHNFSWSPSGDHILFSNGGVSIVDLTGSILQTFDGDGTDYASWSPDGTSIAVHRKYQRRDGTVGVIFIMDADGSNPRVLATKEAYRDWVAKHGEQVQQEHLSNTIYLDPAQAPHRYPSPSECMISAAQRGMIAECMTLLRVGASLAANPPLDWDPREPLYGWEGVEVGRHNEGVRVVSLRLHQRRMTGSISPMLGNLAFLEEIDLRDNWLTGSIPKELGSLSELQVLSLSHNRLTGSIPPELGSLQNLAMFGLDSNMLQGRIPPELGRMSNLENMFLGSNRLSGQIPPELGELHKLKSMDLSFNELSGEIPAELADLNELEYLRLGQNELTGTIPRGLGSQHIRQHIREIDLGYNRLVGPIPSDMFANNATLSFVGLELTECIPSEWRQYQYRVKSFGFGHDYCDDGA